LKVLRLLYHSVRATFQLENENLALSEGLKKVKEEEDAINAEATELLDILDKVCAADCIV
jgi:hypothetical protein